MKVRISYLVDVSDDFRKAMNHYFGKPGLATREDIQSWYFTYGRENDDNLLSEHAVCCFGEEPSDYHPRD